MAARPKVLGKIHKRKRQKQEMREKTNSTKNTYKKKLLIKRKPGCQRPKSPGKLPL